MITINKLTKTYQQAKNVYVKALDNLSISFDRTGFTFITGKSGSGKTTLLNILGTLDIFDEGDIFISGKSIKGLSPKELDCYRNSYIGFVFQEYNLLDYFSVEKNIEIALELQGINSKKEDISKALEQVDLQGYEKRMPYELSSGEKQRVAIARALIKSPKIILADEPTGALDSENGKMIMNIFKKIAKDRLVIVVSHDLELAIEYGDRVIEITDGKLVSDTLPHHDVDSNPGLVDIKSLSRSKLPFIYSFKIGLNNFRRKFVRLILSIILSAIAFIAFAISDNIGNFEKKQTTLLSIYDADIYYLPFTKFSVNKEQYGTEIYRDSLIMEEDIDTLKQKFPGYSFVPVIKEFHSSFGSSLYYENEAKNSGNCYSQRITGGVELTQDLLTHYNLRIIAGRMPEKTQAENEIVITKYVFDQFVKFKYKSESGALVHINNPFDLIDKTIKIGDNDYIIRGIIDTNFNNTRYNYCLNNSNENLSYAAHLGYTSQELNAILKYDFHTVIFLREGYYKEVVKVRNSEKIIFDYNFSETPVYLAYQDDNTSELNINTSAMFKEVYKYNNNGQEIIWKDGIEKSHLEEHEVIIPVNTLRFFSHIGYDFKEEVDDKLRELILLFVSEHYNEIKNEFSDFRYSNTEEGYYYYIFDGNSNEYHSGKNREYFENLAVNQVCGEIFFPALLDLTLYRDYNGKLSKWNVTVVGFTNINEYDAYKSFPIVTSNELFQNILNTNNGQFLRVFTTLKENYHEDIKLVDFSYVTDDNFVYKINNEVTAIVSRLSYTIKETAATFFYIGLCLAVFASILLFNFINQSILIKIRDIGILRALGARSKDIFLIFINEDTLIAFTNTIIAIIGSYLLMIVFNHQVSTNYDLLITFSNIGFRQIIFILLISMLVALFSTLLPILLLRKQKPIEIIKKL